MTKIKAAHASGTTNIGDKPTVPTAPVKDHSHDAEQLEADRQARDAALRAEARKRGMSLRELRKENAHRD